MTFAPGETRKCILFSAHLDDIKEDTETSRLTITLMEQEGVFVGDPGETEVTIVDTTGKCKNSCSSDGDVFALV